MHCQLHSKRCCCRCFVKSVRCNFFWRWLYVKNWETQEILLEMKCKQIRLVVRGCLPWDGILKRAFLVSCERVEYPGLTCSNLLIIYGGVGGPGRGIHNRTSPIMQIAHHLHVKGYYCTNVKGTVRRYPLIQFHGFVFSQVVLGRPNIELPIPFSKCINQSLFA